MNYYENATGELMSHKECDMLDHIISVNEGTDYKDSAWPRPIGILDAYMHPDGDPLRIGTGIFLLGLLYCLLV